MKRLSLAALALMVGCGGPPHPAESPRASGTPSSMKVVTEEVTRENLTTTIQLSGQVQPTEDRTVFLTAPLDGVVVRPLVKVGSLVVQNQPLVEMNSVYGMTSLQILEKLESEQDQVVEARTKLSNALTNLGQAQTALGQAQALVSSKTADLRQAEADLAFARRDARRKKDLFEAGISSRTEMEESQVHLTKAQALTDASRDELAIARQQIPLFRNNISEYQQAVNLARQAVSLTESNFERNKAVFSQASLVGTEIPPELTALRLDSSHSHSTAQQASQFFVRSPITGVVTKLGITAGQRLQSGNEMGQVVELSQVYVDANCFEGDVARLHAGDHIEVTSTSIPTKKFRGRICYVGEQVNPQTRTIQVRSQIENPQGDLRPDTFVDVQVLLPARQNALVIPEKALLTLGNEEFVMVEDGPQHYRKQPVEVGVKANDQVEILKGLSVGQKVVTEGNLLLESREN